MRVLGSVTRLFLAALLAIAALAPRTQAQCGADNLDTQPCCSPLGVTLPASFPSVTQQVRYVCFRDCGIAVNQQVCVTIGAPVPVLIGGIPVCGVYLINFQFRTCGSNQLLYSGNMRAHYARNWLERDPLLTRGVWRFLLNGDLVPTALVPNNPNAKPPCIGTYNRAYFSGYIDYALDCSVPNSWLAAFALDHDCDRTTHVTGTQRPIGGGSHPNRSYVFVGPSAGFVVDPANGPWVTGAIAAEATRKNNWPARPAICLAEEQILAPGVFSPLAPTCDCMPNPPGSPTQLAQTVLMAFGGCGTRFDTQGPPIGPFPFSQKAIGYWTIPNTFPSAAHLFIDKGTVQHFDGCSSNFTIQFLEGVTTLSGSAIMNAYSGAPLGPNFVDLGTSNAVGGAVRVGVPHVVWYLLGLNF